MNSIPNTQESVHWLYIFTQVIQQPCVFSGMLLKNPPNCVKNFLWNHHRFDLWKKKLGDLCLKPNNPKPASNRWDTQILSLLWSRICEGQRTHRRPGHRRLTLPFSGFRWKSKKIALKKKRAGGNNHLSLQTFWSLFFLFVQGCFAVICESRWSEGSSWVGIPKQIQWKRIAWPLPKGGNVT